MNLMKVEDFGEMSEAVKSAGPKIVERIKWCWQEDLRLRNKWNFTNSQAKELVMKEICFLINDEQIELLRPVMEEEPKCQVIHGEASLEILSLVFKFGLTDTKVKGTMRSYSPSKPCKSFPYELLLKNVEFKIMAGLTIRGDSIFIENYSYDFLNFNVHLSYKNKDESKEICLLDKIENQDLRKIIERYIADKLCKDVIIAIEDKIADDCTDMSVSGFLYNDYNYRNKLRLHKKRMNTAFHKLVGKILELTNAELDRKKLSEMELPDLYGKLGEKDNERDHFTVTGGSLKSISTLQKFGDIAIYTEGDDTILLAFLYFSYLDITYKDLSISQKDSEEHRLLDVPDNSNSAYVKIKIKKISKEKFAFELLEFKIDDIGYVDIIWEKQEQAFKKPIEPEVALWLNYALEYKTVPAMEERITECMREALKSEQLSGLAISKDCTEDAYDSDPLCEDKVEDEDESKSQNNDNESSRKSSPN